MRYTVDQAARSVRKSARTVRRWIADGHVQASAEPGKLGTRYTFTRDQLEALRTYAARDAEPAIPTVEPVASAEPVAELEQTTALAPASAAQPLDLAGLVAAVSAAVDAERQAGREQLERQAASYRAQLDAERQAHAAIVAAMRAQLDAERRRADDAADATAHARALLEDARGLVAAQAATIAAMQQRAATTATRSTRSTQPLDRGALRSIAGGV
jgi:hypothetical protein